MQLYGLYPRAVEHAMRVAENGSIDGFIQALIEEPPGRPDCLALALIRTEGVDRFVNEIARCLDRPIPDVAAALTRYLERPSARDAAMTGAEAVALVLREAGVTAAFAYVGTSELALCDSLARLPGIALVNSRGDKEAAFMAAGGSLLDHVRAVAVLHGARGLTNATGAVADVRRNEVATVFVVGLPSTGSAPFLPPHGESGLIETIGRLAKWSYEAGPVPREEGARREAADRFVAALRGAIRRARTVPRGPCVFGLPQDVAESAWIPWESLAGAAPEQPDRAPPSELTAAAAELLARRRALILVDDYLLRHDGARPALARFAARAAAPVLQARYRRGAMLFERLTRGDVPSFAGWYDPQRPDHRALMAGADLLVTLEDRNLYPRVVGGMPDCRKIAISSDAAKVRKNGYLADDDLLLEGDVVAILRSLTALLERHPDGEHLPGWAGAVRIHAAAEPTAGADAVARLLRAGIVQTLADAMVTVGAPVVVDDSQMFGGLVCEQYDSLPSGVRVFGDHGGFVGGGIAYATGLAVANPAASVFCLLGDQGFINGMQGLVAAGQERARVVYLVCNNGQSVSLLEQSAAVQPRWFDGGRQPHLHNPPAVDYAQVAGRLGIPASAVRFPLDEGEEGVRAALSDLAARLSEAATAAGPVLIELRLPGRGPLWDGIWRTEGYERVGGAPRSDAIDRGATP